MNEVHSFFLQGFTDWLMEQFSVYPVDGMTAHAPTGEKFISFCNYGPKPPGERQPLCNTGERAVDLFVKHLKRYIKDKKGTLYWRRYPVLTKQGGRYQVWARLLISDKRRPSDLPGWRTRLAQ